MLGVRVAMTHPDLAGRVVVAKTEKQFESFSRKGWVRVADKPGAVPKEALVEAADALKVDTEGATKGDLVARIEEG